MDAAAALGYSGLVAPLTFTSIPAMAANRLLLGYGLGRPAAVVASVASAAPDAPAQRLLSRHACVEIDDLQSQRALGGYQAVATRAKS